MFQIVLLIICKTGWQIISRINSEGLLTCLFHLHWEVRIPRGTSKAGYLKALCKATVDIRYRKDTGSRKKCCAYDLHQHYYFNEVCFLQKLQRVAIFRGSSFKQPINYRAVEILSMENTHILDAFWLE